MPTATRPTARPETSRPANRSLAPTNTARGDPGVLRTLTDTCRYWTAQNTDGQFRGNQEMACRDMVSYAREHGMTVPPVGGSGPKLPAPTREPAVRPPVQVHVDQCERYGYGTIGYRQCRANEKQRLTNLCNELRAQKATARGAQYDRVSQRASAVCREADLYEIVN